MQSHADYSNENEFKQVEFSVSFSSCSLLLLFSLFLSFECVAVVLLRCELQFYFVYCLLCSTQRRRLGNLSSLFLLNANTHIHKRNGERVHERGREKRLCNLFEPGTGK